MPTASHVGAEIRLVLQRLRRTRFGVWALALAAATTGLAISAGATDAAGTAVRLGLLTVLMGVGFCTAPAADRAAVDLARTQPVTVRSLAVARWVALTGLGAATVMLHVVALGAVGVLRPAAIVAGVAAGVGGAGAAAGAGLCAAWFGGNGLVGALFAYVILVSGVSPDLWTAVAPPGVVGTVGNAVLQVLPALWRYRTLAGWDAGAWLHAGAWSGGGIALAAWCLSRRSR